MLKPNLLPGEVCARPVAGFAWLPVRLQSGIWVWLKPIWVWSCTQKWLFRPVDFTLYTRRRVAKAR